MTQKRPHSASFLMARDVALSPETRCTIPKARWRPIQQTASMTIIDRLLRACATGVGCRALINTRVLDSIKPDLWPAIDALRDVRFGRNERFERASRLCANLSCIRCGALQLGLKVLDLNTEGFLKILGAQKLLPEVSVGCNL